MSHGLVMPRVKGRKMGESELREFRIARRDAAINQFGAPKPGDHTIEMPDGSRQFYPRWASKAVK